MLGLLHWHVTLFHYQFNRRDLSRITHGLTLLGAGPKRTCPPSKLAVVPPCDQPVTTALSPSQTSFLVAIARLVCWIDVFFFFFFIWVCVFNSLCFLLNERLLSCALTHLLTTYCWWNPTSPNFAASQYKRFCEEFIVNKTRLAQSL